jgi:Protein of unknown function (DUF3147)
MRIRIGFGGMRRPQPGEYLLRFLFGGSVTVAAGFLASRYGPLVGGLFLAFPAIFPASVTLLAKHENRRRAKRGLDGSSRGRRVAAVDACGAALGSFGLLLFAATLRILLPVAGPVPAFASATVAWFAGAFGLWWVRRKL